MINGQIRDREVRVIGTDGEQLGVMSARDAQKLADEAELDLIKIAPKAKPPVCKIMDYGKFRSLLLGAPVLIWQVFRATARSAIVVSAVSPER